MTPELPFDRPADANTVSVEVKTVNDGSRTRLVYNVSGAGGEAFVRTVSAELNSKGWPNHTASWNKATKEGQLSGTRDGETLDVRVFEKDWGIQVQTVWEH